jgi:hypothetical protein
LGEPGTSIFDVLMSNVGYDERHGRNDMVWLGDHVEAGYQELLKQQAISGHRTRRLNLLYGLSNYHLKFASLASLIEPSRPACQE